LIDYRFWLGDALTYDRIAINLAEHGVYSLSTEPPYVPTVVRAPLLPLELASFYRVLGHHPIIPQLFQIVLTTLACVALALAVAALELRAAPADGADGRAHAPPVRVARWVLWMTLLSPFDAVYSGHLISEALCTTCIVGALVSPVLLQRFGWLASGIFLGAAALDRDVFLLLIPLLASLLVVIGVRRPEFSALKRDAAVVVLGASLVILPWTARNYAATGRVVLISKGLGLFNLWVGTWEKNGDWATDTLVAHIPDEAYRSPEEKALVKRMVATEDYDARDKLLLPLVVDRYRTEPARVLWTWTKRSYKPWIGTRFDLFVFRPAFLARGTAAWKVVKSGLFALNAVVLLAGAAGVVIALRRRSPLAWFAIPMVYCLFIYIPFHNVETRYTQPVYACVLVFVAVTIVAMEDARRARMRREVP
ncbi:MAG TPA: hypothetical protein VEK07_20990, partial [Polyangiaceae bacterium]|nr:hypothetical protein [Polyangiaceae bacterium]